MVAIHVGHKVVSREAWLEARTALLEKAFTRLGDQLSADQRAFRWDRHLDKQEVNQAESSRFARGLAEGAP